MKFKNILFPVDGSARSAAAAPFVNSLLRKYKASLTLLHAVEIPAVWYAAAEAAVTPEYDIDHLIKEAEHRLTFFGGEAFPGIQPKICVEQGDPGEFITAFAQENAIDLIMMPTRGRGVFRTALLGSVTAKVLHDAHCPVWTDAHTETTEYAVSPDIRKIVCSIDAASDSKPLIRIAAELAKENEAEVWLVHAVPAPPPMVQERYFDTDFDVLLKDAARKSIAETQTELGTNFKVCLGSGTVADIVAAAALDHKADLVLAGRGEAGAFAGRLRTHLYSVIRDVACPVLSI